MATINRKEWYTVQEAAREFGLGPSRVRQFLLSGRIEGWKVNANTWMISAAEVARFKALPRLPGKPGHTE